MFETTLVQPTIKFLAVFKTAGSRRASRASTAITITPWPGPKYPQYTPLAAIPAFSKDWWRLPRCGLTLIRSVSVAPSNKNGTSFSKTRGGRVSNAMEPMTAPAVEITISEAYSRTRSLMRCLIAMSAKKLAGVTPTAFVTAALTGEIPVASKTGKEITDAPPAIPLITPTSKPTAAMAMNSSICQPYTRYMASVQVRLFAVARAKAGTELISCEPGSLASIIESLKAHGELANVLPQCSYLVDGLAPSDLNQNISAGSTIDVLPRFAGGA